MNLGHTVQLITSSVCSGDRKSAGGAIEAEQKPVKEQQQGERSDPTFYFRAQDSLEELSHVEGQEGLCFAGAAVKRYPTPRVRETHVRQ